MIMALPNHNQGFTVTWFGDSEVDPDFSINFSESMKHFRMDKITRPSKLLSVKAERWNHEDWLLLLGDACHGIVPFYGQGMNCGFEDITVFFSALSKYGREEAFKNFYRLRKPDTDAIAELSKRNFDIMAKYCASGEFQAREVIKRATSIRYPLYQPIYVLVTHTNTPYSLCLKACALENELVQDITVVDAWMKEKWMPFLCKHNLVIPCITYDNYLCLNNVLNSQFPVSSCCCEMLFIVMHQTVELWMKLLLYEFKLIMPLLECKNFDAAEKKLPRIHEVFKVMLQQWNVLLTMSVEEYSDLRPSLGSASGFQSFQYKELVSCFERLEAMKGGFPSSLMARLRQLDELHMSWRKMHVNVAEKYIGDDKGTGGSAGVEFLRKRATRTFFS